MHPEIKSWQSRINFAPEIKKAQWGEGEWVNEPDLIFFTYEDILCRIIRMAVWEEVKNEHLSLGHLNGYIKVPPSHPWYSKEYDTIDCVVHGGLTYGEMEPDGWWIGFDCAHSMDEIPSLRFIYSHIEQEIKKSHLLKECELCCLISREYKDVEFVRNEIISLVDEMLAVKQERK
jgi:hypothetical protein